MLENLEEVEKALKNLNPNLKIDPVNLQNAIKASQGSTKSLSSKPLEEVELLFKKAIEDISSPIPQTSYAEDTSSVQEAGKVDSDFTPDYLPS